MTLKDQAIVARYIGSIYPLVFLELGIDFDTIQEVRGNGRDIELIVNGLLNIWCRLNPNDNSLGRILNTMCHYGLSTRKIVKRIAKRKRVVRT